MLDLLAVSAPVGSSGSWRPLEVTLVIQEDVIPWHYSATRELQFGEWLRQDLLNGVFEPPVQDHDLAILLTKARQHSIALVGISAETLFEPIPPHDFYTALSDTIAQGDTEASWKGDERNVVLALARIWYSASTGQIAPKDVAAAWVLNYLPLEHQLVLSTARSAYLGLEQNNPVIDGERMTAFIQFAKSVIEQLLIKKEISCNPAE